MLHCWNALSQTTTINRHLLSKKPSGCFHGCLIPQRYVFVCSFSAISLKNAKYNDLVTLQLAASFSFEHDHPRCFARCPTEMAESGQNVDKQSEGSSVSDTINKQGWLSKRSRLSKHWDKRWCCLKKNELSYGLSAEVR